METGNFMQSVLDTMVSCFEMYHSANNPRSINLLDWLKSSQHQLEITAIRKELDKEKRSQLKALLPAITPHGLFTYRSADHLVQHSRLIQFDIDFQDNPHVANFQELKTELSKIRNVAYVGLSVSGNGFWGLIPIEKAEFHSLYFDHLVTMFNSFGIVIDKKPRNVAALRGCSYDPEAYFNHHAERLKYYKKQSPPAKRINQGAAAKQIEDLVKMIDAAGIDIAPTYDNWVRIGFALADELHEAGRHYFHQISAHHPTYNTIKTDEQYTKCLQHRGRGITIASFFYLSKEAGITLK